LNKVLIILIVLAIAVALFTGGEFVKDKDKEKAVNRVYDKLNALASIQGRNIDERLVKRELTKLTTPELSELDIFAGKVLEGRYFDTLGSLERTQTILSKTNLYNMLLGILTQRY